MLLGYALQEVLIRWHKPQEYAQNLHYFNEKVLIAYLVTIFKLCSNIFPDQERFSLLRSLTKYAWPLLIEKESFNEFANQFFRE